MKNKDLEEVHRLMNCFSRMPLFNGHIKKELVDLWLENYSDLVFCNGHGRRIIFTPITENTYKIHSAAL